VRLLYTRGLVIVTLILLALGTDSVLSRELQAVGGAVETLLFGALLMLLASWLALTASQEQRQQKRWKRLLAYTGWGLTVGLGLWSHMLVAPFVLASGLILLVFCWDERRTWAIPCILAGLVIGGFPLIYYNLTAPLKHNSLEVALAIQVGRGLPGKHASLSALQYIVSTFLYGLPVASGYTGVCSQQVLPIYGQVGPDTWICALAQGGWSLGYMALLLISMAMAIVPFRWLRKERRSHPETWSEEQRQASVIHFARLMLVGCGALTIFLYLVSPLAAKELTWTRYLIGLLIVLPAVIWPLWNGIGRRSISASTTSTIRFWIIFRYSLLLLVGIVFLWGTANLFVKDIPGAVAAHQQDEALIHGLEQRGIVHIYSDYWTCDRLIFESDEHIICGAVDAQLKENLNRYLPYWPMVTSAPNVSYMFMAGSFAEVAARNPLFSSGRYHRFTLDGYVIYQPT
jgi:hypothetical protein